MDDYYSKYGLLISALKAEGKSDFEIKTELPGMHKALNYIDSLIQDQNGGLLEHEILCEVASCVLNSRVGYSENDRVTEFQGSLKSYCAPDKIYHYIQLLIDEFNKGYWKLKDSKTSSNEVLKTLIVKLVITFLQIHPFRDGNGRTIRLIVYYILKSYDNTIVSYSFNMQSYHDWCKCVYNEKGSELLDRFEIIYTFNTKELDAIFVV